MKIDLLNILALVVAIGSYFYTWHFNRYSVDIFGFEKEVTRNHTLVTFKIANTSTRLIRITDVSLLHEGKSINDNGFDPRAYEEQLNQQRAEEWTRKNTHRTALMDFPPVGINPFILNNSILDTINMESYNFDGPVYLKPSDDIEFSYYLDELPDMITITTDKRITFLKNQKSVPTFLNN